jgi:uncharacterized radical SAM superfamily Fe-S cluster-containing enzyme
MINQYSLCLSFNNIILDVSQYLNVYNILTLQSWNYIGVRWIIQLVKLVELKIKEFELNLHMAAIMHNFFIHHNLDSLVDINLSLLFIGIC